MARLAARKLDASLGFCWNAITHGGTIAPAADGLENCLIFRGAGAFQNEGAMHATVCAHDKTHLHLDRRITPTQHWIGRGEGFRRMGSFAARTSRRVWHLREFGVVNGGTQQLELIRRERFIGGTVQGLACIRRHDEARYDPRPQPRPELARDHFPPQTAYESGEQCTPICERWGQSECQP